MSLKTNKDNIYIFSPDGRYSNYDTTSWSSFMEKDFTIVVNIKFDVDTLVVDETSYFIARNGKHAGLKIYKDTSNNLHLTGNYWFWKNESLDVAGKTEFLTPVSIERHFTYCLLPEERDVTHEFIIRCDNTDKKIYYYMDGKLLGEIDYEGLDKCSYKEAYMYLGCATMLSDNDWHKHIGNFEYNFLMCLNKCISMDEIIDLKTNYKDKYYEDYFGFPILNENTPYKENISVFMDFEYTNTYKIWNAAFNGCIPNFYIKDNTIY